MFNWTTTTIINSLKDFNSDKDLINWNGETEVLKIKRDFTFEKKYTASISRAVAADPAMFKMTIDLKTLVEKLAEGEKDTTGTLAFYIGLEGSEESIYANDWYQKGRPFSIGFDYTYAAADKASSTGGAAKGEAMVDSIIANATKYGVMTFGKKVFTFSKDSTNAYKLVIEGAHEYQRLMKAAVITDDGIYDKFIYTYEDNGTASQGIFALNTRGTNGFGTYTQLIKDLRLPTPENTKFYKIMADEMPVFGAKYNQYIVTYMAPSLANPGLSVIGQRDHATESTHVFWVNQSIDVAFRDAMLHLGTVKTYSPADPHGTAELDSYTFNLTNATLALDSSTTSGSVAAKDITPATSTAVPVTTTYKSDNTAAATVSTAGLVTRVASNKGNANITVTVKWTDAATGTVLATETKVAKVTIS